MAITVKFPVDGVETVGEVEATTVLTVRVGTNKYESPMARDVELVPSDELHELHSKNAYLVGLLSQIHETSLIKSEYLAG